MYAASQAGVEAISPYVEALVGDEKTNGRWKRVIDDMGFPAGGPRTMTADLTGKLAAGHAEDSHHDQSAGLLGQHSDRSHGTGSASPCGVEIPRPAGEKRGGFEMMPMA